MSLPPDLTDRAALARNRARALARGAELFLHEDAAAEAKERLSEVNKTFTKPAVVAVFPGPWREILPDARRPLGRFYCTTGMEKSVLIRGHRRQVKEIAVYISNS